MLQVYICVGSSCHLKGSYYVIKTFQSLIRENHLEDKVDIKASFCLGHCTKGVSVKIDDEFIDDLTLENAGQKFREYIMNRLDEKRL